MISSRSEGGANVMSESIVAGVPVLASDIPGNVGLLGRSYAGFFKRGDAGGLAHLIYRAERDDTFYTRLCRSVVKLSGLFDPEKERKAWGELLKQWMP